jgi:hypothetical protein
MNFFDFIFLYACVSLAAATVLFAIKRVFGKGTRRTETEGE